MDTFSTCREIFEQQQTEPASQPTVMSVDRWDEAQMRWAKKFYAWNDAEGSYSIDVSDQYNQDGSRRWGK